MSMLIRAQIVLFLVCLAFAVSLQQQCGDTVCCQKSWLGYNGYCYRYFAYKKTWSGAREYCDSLDAHLVSIHSATENAIIHALTSGGRAWIGLTDSDDEGTFTWSDGTTSDFTSWDQGSSQPNDLNGVEDCAEMNRPGHAPGSWNDNTCSYLYPFVCKK